MEWKRGQVARSLAGHDKGSFFTVLEVAPPYGVVADGKRRPLERPAEETLPPGAHGDSPPGRGPENQSKHTQRLAALSRCRGEVKYGGFFYVKAGRN